MDGLIIINRNENQKIVIPESKGEKWESQLAKILLPYLKKDLLKKIKI